MSEQTAREKLTEYIYQSRDDYHNNECPCEYCEGLREGVAEKLDELIPKLVKEYSAIQDVEITSPTYFEDNEPCGYCNREVGQKHQTWCRQ